MTSTIVVTFLVIGLLGAPAMAWPDWLDSMWEAAAEAYDWTGEAVRGAGDMGRAYLDMREANFKTVGTDKYFHARGNYDAAQQGPGGRWAAEVISDGREAWQGTLSGHGDEDIRADQEANEWGRNGGDPNRYRPEGLDKKY